MDCSNIFLRLNSSSLKYDWLSIDLLSSIFILTEILTECVIKLKESLNWDFQFVFKFYFIYTQIRFTVYQFRQWFIRFKFIVLDYKLFVAFLAFDFVWQRFCRINVDGKWNLHMAIKWDPWIFCSNTSITIGMLIWAFLLKYYSCCFLKSKEI